MGYWLLSQCLNKVDRLPLICDCSFVNFLLHFNATLLAAESDFTAPGGREIRLCKGKIFFEPRGAHPM